jgi:hypothetical protein
MRATCPTYHSLIDFNQCAANYENFSLCGFQYPAFRSADILPCALLHSNITRTLSILVRRKKTTAIGILVITNVINATTLLLNCSAWRFLEYSLQLCNDLF